MTFEQDPAVWQAVIEQAVRDVTRPEREFSHMTAIEAAQGVVEAYTWIMDDGYYLTVCRRAGADPEEARDKVRGANPCMF